MKVLRITDNGRTVNHCDGSCANSYTLCGLDDNGDKDCGISPSKKINGKITCPDCIAIIRRCHKVRLEDTGGNEG